jgi:hypothetical protein
VILHAREHVREVLEGIDPARLACRDERVQSRDARAAVAVVDEEVILPAECDAPERTLRAVVVERQPRLVEEDAQLVPRRPA